MKKGLIIIFMITFSFNSFSQISFEKGYYINNNNKKIDCLIKNVDWKNNPIEFNYKLLNNEDIQIASIHSIKEFGINNYSKFIRSKVNIDRSSEYYNELSIHKNPLFNEEQLFLKVLVEGETNLYFYQDKGLVRFFYKTSTSNIEQLVFKSYIIEDNKIGENKGYQRQLWQNLKCQSISMKNVENVDYKKNDLVNFFMKYNECNNSNLTNYESKKQKKLFNFNIKAGLNNSTLDLKYGNNNASQDFDTQSELEIRLGIEAEFILPFNKNKWAILLEPTYQQLKFNKTAYGQIVKVDYSSIELPVGIRHYFFLNNSSKIFVNALYVIDFTSSSKVDFENQRNVEIKGSNYFAVGVGYNYNAKYTVEMRYGFNRDILEENPLWVSDYNTLSLILGYTIF